MISRPSNNTNFKHMSIANCTCHFFQQPLDHFGLGSSSPPHTFQQRYCVYDGYVINNNTAAPIFFYTGNESPVEMYANNTGLLWNLAEEFGALVVFAEHRYEGKSLPDFAHNVHQELVKHCMSYCTSNQAMADYSLLLDYLNPGSQRPVIAFGGSYGGMLSSWMRMKYPSSIAGAIAASAPIWGFAETRPPLDAAYTAIARTVSSAGGATDKCFDNLLAAWVIIREVGKTDYGRQLLSDRFRLCDSLDDVNDVERLIEYAHSPWFLLAEANYPFASSYITGSNGAGPIDLPPWPVRFACDQGLNGGHNITIEGNKSEVKFNVKVGDIMNILVDWNTTVPDKEYSDDDIKRSNVDGLFDSVSNAISVWFNVTGDKTCFDLSDTIPDDDSFDSKAKPTNLRHNAFNELTSDGVKTSRYLSSKSKKLLKTTPGEICNNEIQEKHSWEPIVCNENMYMIIYLAKGMGNDFMWPPNYPRNSTIEDVIGVRGTKTGPCPDGDGLFGYPVKGDPWATWLDEFYGGLRIGMYSNIVFTNGLLDPWSGGGVYPKNPPEPGKYDGRLVEEITEDGSIISAVIDLGGHHLDLMFPSDDDPQSVKDVRAIQKNHVKKWIDGWKSQSCVKDVCSRGI